MSVTHWTLALLAAAAIATPALAQPASCMVDSGTMEFDEYDVFAAQPARTVAQIRVICTRPVAAAVTLSPGSSSDYDQRKMIGPKGVLTYNLYADAGGHRIAGDGTDGTVPLLQRTRNLSRDLTFTVYGEIDARQMVPPGDYLDIVHVTVEF